MNEEWRPAKGCTGADRCEYEVSSRGRVRSRFVRCGHGWRILKQVDAQGYRRVDLGRSQPRKMVHILVLTAFVGPCPEGMQTRHLNGNRADNRLGNLAWGTAKENVGDKFTHGTIAFGKDHPLVRLDESKVREIRTSRASQRALARRFGVAKSTIAQVQSGVTWRGVR